MRDFQKIATVGIIPSRLDAIVERRTYVVLIITLFTGQPGGPENLAASGYFQTIAADPYVTLFSLKIFLKIKNSRLAFTCRIQHDRDPKEDIDFSLDSIFLMTLTHF